MVETGLVGRIGEIRKLGHAFANSFGEGVEVSVVPEESLDRARAGIDRRFSPVVPLLPSPAVAGTPAGAMGKAPFVYDTTGRPHWSGMWESFCELALFGGPPHRGPERPLRVGDRGPGGPARKAKRVGEFDAVVEIRRGIEETTGLATAPAQPGWLGVACESPRMAAWLCAVIILENVDARAEGKTLLIPASDDYRLEDEVKSVITVVAKTHHYWLAHARADRGGDRCTQSSFRSR